MQPRDRLGLLARLEREFDDEERRVRGPIKERVASLVANPPRDPHLPHPPAAQTASKWGNPPKKNFLGIAEARRIVDLGARRAKLCISWCFHGECRNTDRCHFQHPQETEMRALVNSPGFWAAMGTWDKYTAAGGASI